MMHDHMSVYSQTWKMKTLKSSPIEGTDCESVVFAFQLCARVQHGPVDSHILQSTGHVMVHVLYMYTGAPKK